MSPEALASWLVGLFALIGLFVCICAGLVACAHCIGWTRWKLKTYRAGLKHQDAISEAVREWKERNPQKVAALQRMRDELRL